MNAEQLENKAHESYLHFCALNWALSRIFENKNNLSHRDGQEGVNHEIKIMQKLLLKIDQEINDLDAKIDELVWFGFYLFYYLQFIVLFMSDQYKSRYTNRHDVSMDGIYSLDLPDGTYKMIDEAFKKWEIRRGFISEDQQKLGLRGRAYHYGLYKNRKKENESCEKSVSNTVKPATTKSKKKRKKVVGKKVKKSARSISRKSRWKMDSSRVTLSNTKWDSMVEFCDTNPEKRSLQAAETL